MKTTFTVTGLEKGHNKLRQGLEQLKEISFDDLKELIRLDAQLASGGGDCPAEVLADQPVHVGGIKLYMPTLGATEFLEQKIKAWFSDDVYTDLFTAYVLSYSRRPDVLRQLTS